MTSPVGCVLVTLLAAVLIGTGLAIGLAIGNGETTVDNSCKQEVKPTPPTSPLSVPQSESKEGRYRFAAVAADAEECSKIGTRIMGRDGGSAMDAAIAAILCIGVYNCHNCGIGGGHFLVYYHRASGEVRTINAREQAPSGATQDMFVPERKVSSQDGGMSIGIPGEIKGLYEAHRLGGRLPWAKLFEPTLKLCREGFKVSKSLAFAINHTAHFHTEYSNLKELTMDPETNSIYKAGDFIRLPLLANTLDTIAREGPDAFYRGSLSRDISLDILDAGGIITESDLANYTVSVSEPVTSEIHDNQRVYSSPPPSSGAIYQFILNILNGYNMTRDSVSSADKSVLTWHRVAEAFKHAYALRTQLGDSGVGTVDFKRYIRQLVNNMTSADYGEHIRSQISDDQTFGWQHYNPSFHSDLDHGTSHLSVLAPNGDVVSVTCTINLLFGSKVVGSRTGIIFNDEMDDFSTPNTENYFGVPASPANYIAPWKRPLSSMCPSIVIGPNDEARLVVGASGGTKITTSTALVTIEALWFGWGIKEAIDYPRLHHQLFPPVLTIQREFPKVLVEGLREKGHDVDVIPLTGVNGVIVQGILQRELGEITANSDYRKGSEADGY